MAVCIISLLQPLTTALTARAIWNLNVEKHMTQREKSPDSHRWRSHLHTWTHPAKPSFFKVWRKTVTATPVCSSAPSMAAETGTPTSTHGATFLLMWSRRRKDKVNLNWYATAIHECKLGFASAIQTSLIDRCCVNVSPAFWYFSNRNLLEEILLRKLIEGNYF